MREAGRRSQLNTITGEIVASAIEVHRALGPGLLESAYETCLSYELTERGLKVERQKALPLSYKDVELMVGYRLDLLVNDEVVVELKAVDRITKVHEAQILSYLRLSGLQVGLLLNFNVRLMKNGIKRFVHGDFELG